MILHVFIKGGTVLQTLAFQDCEVDARGSSEFVFVCNANQETVATFYKSELIGWQIFKPPEQEAVVHGVNCPKAPHDTRGIAHHPDYDGPVTAGLAQETRENGADYCGRCHERLS